MFGAIEYEDARGATATAVLVNAFLPHQTNGWQHAAGELQRFLDAAATLDPPAAAASAVGDLWPVAVPPEINRAVGPWVHTAAKLGQRLGELHLALAGDDAGQHLGVGHLDVANVERLTERVIASWERATAAALAYRTADDATRMLVGRLADRQGQVVAAIGEARARVPPGLRLTRIHGNLDLSQVLLYEDDVAFIGLGATSRSQSRQGGNNAVRSRTSRVCFVRSNTSARRFWSLRRSATPQEHHRLAAWTTGWVAAAATSVLGSYAAVTAGAVLTPVDPAGFRTLLRLFMLEQACGDLTRSVVSRPAWVPIVLAEIAKHCGRCRGTEHIVASRSDRGGLRHQPLQLLDQFWDGHDLGGGRSPDVRASLIMRNRPSLDTS
jgi:predicted trehalose synthase